MKNKTCGECKHFVVSNYLDVCTVVCENYKTDSFACDYFEPKVISNGDRIRQMSDEELAKIFVCKITANDVFYSHFTNGFYTSEAEAIFATIKGLKQEAKDE